MYKAIFNRFLGKYLVINTATGIAHSAWSKYEDAVAAALELRRAARILERSA